MSLITRALSAAVLALALALPAHGQQPGQTYTGRIQSVTDGDTYDVRVSGGQTFTVRLWGTDAPESAQPYGDDATARARELTRGATVRVSVEEMGRYGRAVARIEVGGGDLGAMLIEDGLAWHYDEYAPNATEYARLERQARNAGRGLWSSQVNPTPPWEWRDRTSGPGETSEEDRDCSDFSTQPEAQRFFERHQPGDPHGLDGDGDGEACESLPGESSTSSSAPATTSALTDFAGRDRQEGVRVGWQVGAGVGGASVASSALYGMYGGVDFQWGRLRFPAHLNLMFASYTPDGYSYDSDVDRCRGPSGQFAEDSDCTAYNTYAWLRGSVLYDVVREGSTRVYLGAGGDVGSVSTLHGVAGLLFRRTYNVELRAGPDQVLVGASLLF